MSAIARPQMMPLLLEADPGFEAEWRSFVVEWHGEAERPEYVPLALFARRMCQLLDAGDEEALRRVFAVIERLHLEGDAYVRQAATIGLLEVLQNSNIHLPRTTPRQFERFLLPESARWWRKVEAFWRTGKAIVDD